MVVYFCTNICKTYWPLISPCNILVRLVTRINVDIINWCGKHSFPPLFLGPVWLDCSCFSCKCFDRIRLWNCLDLALFVWKLLIIKLSSLIDTSCLVFKFLLLEAVLVNWLFKNGVFLLCCWIYSHEIASSILLLSFYFLSYL